MWGPGGSDPSSDVSGAREMGRRRRARVAIRICSMAAGRIQRGRGGSIIRPRAKTSSAGERTGGVVDSTGRAVPDWVRDFLLEPHQSDVLGKLARSGATERHAFILVPGVSIAPFGVVDMLWRDEDDVVPTRSPHLPD